MFISSMNIKSDNLSIYLSINLSIYPFIYLSIYLCIHLFIYLSIYLSLRPPLPSSVHLTSISQTCNLILASFANNRGPATSHHNRAAPCHRRGDTPPPPSPFIHIVNITYSVLLRIINLACE